MKKQLDNAFFLQKALETSLSKERIEGLALAFSGGKDSTLMAEMLYRLQIPFVAFHFNHHWRGEISNQDAAFVQDWCSDRNISCYVGNGSGPSSEEKARTERWTFFLEKSKELGISHLLLAHHGDDLVETFLWQLFRGVGPEGLAGLQPRREREHLIILRPWFNFFSTEIEACCQLWKLEWREDRSNQDTRYTRNKLRHQIIPWLTEQIERNIHPPILRLANLMMEENDFWAKQMPESWPQQASISWLREQPLPLQRRWIKGWLHSQGIKDISFEDVEATRNLLEKLKPARVNLSHGFWCRRTSGKLWIESPK